MNSVSFEYLGDPTYARHFATDLRQQGLIPTYNGVMAFDGDSTAIVRVPFDVSSVDLETNEIARLVRRVAAPNHNHFDVEGLVADNPDLDRWWKVLTPLDRSQLFDFARAGWGLEIPSSVRELIGRNPPPRGIAFSGWQGGEMGLMLLDDLMDYIDQRWQDDEV